MKTSFFRILSPVLLAGLASLALVAETSARVFVATNSTWRYFKGTSEASDPTNAWRELDFDDSTWLVGAAPFHFGTNALGGDDTLTGGTILSDMRSNYTCIFLRQSFVLPDTNNVAGLWLNAWFDDGLAIWINGQAARNPITVNGLAYTNTATTSREGSVRNALSLSNVVGLLRSGTNVLCLQAFNRSLIDNDFRIDVELAETPPVIALATTAYTVLENVGQLEVRVVGTGVVNPGATVDYVTTNLTAIAGVHYTAMAGTLSFAPAGTNQTIVVPILNAPFAEGTKTFQVILSNPTNAMLGTPTTATVSISDNDVAVQFQFTAYSVAEGAGTVLLGVVRGDDANLPATVVFGTSDATAANGVDYVGFTNTLLFASTERLKFVPVTMLNNAVNQPNRTFRATLSNPVGVSLGTTLSTTVTIVDNDQGVRFEVASCTIAEDAGVALIGVLRGTDDTNSILNVGLATADVTALSGRDYLGLTNTLSFAPGERRKVVPLPILNNGTREGSRNFRVTLSNPSGGVLSSPSSTTVTIQDNDPGVGFEHASYTIPRGPAGDFGLTVLRGNDGALGPIAVDYATSDGTARAGVDYEAVSGTLTFRENETLKSLSILILRGSAGLTFRVTLSNPTSGATLGTATTTVTIDGTNATVTPLFDCGLAIRREWGVNVLTWTGGGTLQRAEKPTGPWQTLAYAASPYSVASPIPTAFYRVTHPRPVSLYIPSGYTGQTNLPLVIMLHGYFLNSADYESYWHIESLAEARGFLYCHPDGLVNPSGYEYWNGTDACCDFYNSGVDDAGYLRGLIEEISRRFAVDRKRVHLFGIWMGGYLAYRMACQSADLIAGIASLSGTTFLDPSRCQPSEPVNILHIHGTADDYFFYYGGAVTTFLPQPLPSNMPPYPSALQTVQTWAAYNGARDPVTDPAPSMDLDLAVPGLETVVMRYTSYPPGGAADLWTINGGGRHQATYSSDFSPRVIDWLLAHPKP